MNSTLFEYKNPEEIDTSKIEYANISKRNFRKVYVVPFKEDIVSLPVILEKTLVVDGDVLKTADHIFEFFEPEKILTTEAFSMSEGEIFRPTGQGIQTKENYIYYIIKDGIVKEIPNYKTLEVLLSERGKSLDSIVVIEASQFDELIRYNNGELDKSEELTKELAPDSAEEAAGGGGGGGGAPPKEEDKISDWEPNMELKSLSESFLELSVLAEGAGAIAQAAKDAAQGSIDTAIAAKEQAEAEAAQAEAEATQATTEANQAIAEADSAAAEAAQAEAEANQAEAEAENLTSSQSGKLDDVVDDIGDVKDDLRDIKDDIDDMDDRISDLE